MDFSNIIIEPHAPILVTGANGFIGTRVITSLVNNGFRYLRCFTKPTSNLDRLTEFINRDRHNVRIELISGNLLNNQDCLSATKDIRVIYHLAAGKGEKSFANAFLNSVVTTRNLLDATLQHSCLKRFVNVSSFSVYNNRRKHHGNTLDESCPIERHADLRGDAYCFAKVKQDEMVIKYGRRFNVPYVLVRPGVVYGPGRDGISGRIGIGTFGIFLHLGGTNQIPLTYVDNCAEAICLSGLKKGIEGEVFNIVDDNLPSSRHFLHLYKKNVRYFKSIYVPHILSFLLCWGWEAYSRWSSDQLPPVFNRKRWYAYWKGTNYSNSKIKTKVGWKPVVTTDEGLSRFFASCHRRGQHA